MNAPLVELVERVTSAEEGSRELDLAVWNAVSRDEQPWRFTSLGSITCDRYGPGAAGNPVVSLTGFTTSLDGAVELLEFAKPGWRLSMDQMKDGWDVDLSEPGNRSGVFSVSHKTLPLALCLALLRALSSQEASK